MIAKILFITVMFFITSCVTNIPVKENMVVTKKAIIWTETFGDNKNPAILLNAGAGSSGLTWPDEFCKKLSSKGFFVIRYDYRNTGKSSYRAYDIDPYKTADLAKDASLILDYYDVKEANIVGFSMGGQVAQFMAVNFPERVSSLTLISTSTSFEDSLNAFEGKYRKEGLSPPDENYIAEVIKLPDPKTQNLEQNIEYYIHLMKLINGSNNKLNDNLYREMARKLFTRTDVYDSYSVHERAMKATYEEHKNIKGKISKKTVVIHGDSDPIFGTDHATSLHESIANSKLVIVKNMGHLVNDNFYEEVIKNIVEISK